MYQNHKITELGQINGIITSYINPDTDGVCSSITFAYYKEKTGHGLFVPIIFGKLNNETKFVLNNFQIPFPKQLDEIDNELKIILVDTHHVSQLSPTIRCENVVEILDHHPAGNPELFPNAKIQNEKVGAVATLITEKLRQDSVLPDKKIAALLIAAILSNTINFSAPSTSQRDKEALEWLKSIFNFDTELTKKMFDAKSDISKMNTFEILNSDYKKFTINDKEIGISQIESTNLHEILERNDLMDAIKNLKNRDKADYIIFNGIDIIKHQSILITFEKQTKRILEKELDCIFENNKAIISRIILRKTDLIPALSLGVTHS